MGRSALLLPSTAAGRCCGNICHIQGTFLQVFIILEFFLTKVISLIIISDVAKNKYYLLWMLLLIIIFIYFRTNNLTQNHIIIIFYCTQIFSTFITLYSLIHLLSSSVHERIVYLMIICSCYDNMKSIIIIVFLTRYYYLPLIHPYRTFSH